MATQELTIVDGPSKFELMLGLFDGNSRNPRSVHFTLLNGSLTNDQPLRVVLCGVSREDGSGESWNFTGYSNGSNVKGYFSTKSRTGHVQITPRE